VSTGSLDEMVIDIMLTKPKPHALVCQLDSQGTVFQRNPRRPDLLALAVAEFLTARRSAFQPVCGSSRAGRDNRSRNPRSRGGSSRGPLEGLCVSGLVVDQGATDAVVDAAGVKIGLKLGINRLRMVLVKP
jgi:hypothetical protein